MNSAPTTKCQQSIKDSSKKLDLQSFNKINVSVCNDAPSARTTFLQWPTPWRCKIERSFGDCSSPRGAGLYQLTRLEVVKLEPATCQARACKLSSSTSSTLGLVRFEPGTRQVRASQLSGSTLRLVKFEAGACRVRAWNLSRSRLGRATSEP